MMLSSSMDGICAAVSMMTVSASGAGSVMAASVAGVATRIGFAAAKICGCSLRSLFNGTFREPASVVCSRLASCVREKSMSHRRRTDSWATIGPMERTCSTSTGESVGGALHGGAIPVGNDGGGLHDVFESRGPPRQLQFSGHGVVRHAAVAQVRHKLIQTGRMELTFQTGAFRQRIQRLLVVIQGLQTLFHRLRSTVSRLPPCGVVASATFNAVISFVSWSCVLMMSSSLAGSTGHPP